MFAKARLANLTIPDFEQSRAAVLNTLASA
jgi:hypothetical protein